MSASMKMSLLNKKILFGQRLKDCKLILYTLFRNKSTKKKPTSSINSTETSNTRQAHGNKNNSENGNGQSLHSFQNIHTKRFLEARCSILVSVPNKKSEIESVLRMCNSCGVVQNVYQYTVQKDHLLIEFQHRRDVDNILETVGYFKNQDQMPFRTRYIYKVPDLHGQTMKRHILDMNLPHIQYIEPVSFDLKTLKDTHLDLSGIISLLHNHHKMTELDIRLRYFLASTIEEMLIKVFPHCQANLFGSSVNGLGNRGCDLDVDIDFSRDIYSKGGLTQPLKFMTRKLNENPRQKTKQLLNIIGDMVEIFMPSIYSVNKILRARVPIVKFQHSSTNIHCDININNGSGPKMAEILFTWGELYPQIKPLVAVIKHWAKVQGLTRLVPGPQVSNFMLIMMVVCYLQSLEVLPSFQRMQELADHKDTYIHDEIDYSFCTDISKLRHQNYVEKDLGDLLKGFFHFYSSFDFKNTAISVIMGRAVNKSCNDPLCIENPLDINHNVSRNVSKTHLNDLIVAIQMGKDILDKADKQSLIKDFLVLKKKTTDLVSSFHISNLFFSRENQTNNERSDVPLTEDEFNQDYNLSVEDRFIQDYHLSEEIEDSEHVTDVTKESKQFIQSDSSHSNNGDTSDNETDKLARNVR